MPYRLLEKASITAISLVYAWRISTIQGLIIPLLLALILTSLLDLLSSRAFRLAVLALWLCFQFLFPLLVLFSPLLMHVLKPGKELLVFAPVIMTVFIRPADLDFSQILSTILLCGLATLISLRNTQTEHAKQKSRQARDTAEEARIRMESQQKYLHEQQELQLQMATLNERNRIARDIHDSVGHVLSSALLQTGALLTAHLQGLNHEALIQLRNTLDEGMTSVRASVHQLHDDSIELETQIDMLCRSFSFCPIEYSIALYENPPAAIKMAILAIIREAMANVIKHSGASQFELQLREHPAFYQLTLADNGCGAIKNRPEGLGLSSIRERVSALRGQLQFFTESGWKIFITLPKESADDTPDDCR